MTARTLPSGTVAFAFTDVEGSTALLRRLGDRWAPLLATCEALLRSAVEAADGVVVDSEGDGMFLAFPDVRSAVTGLVAAQTALLAHAWPADAPVRVRAGVHAGQAQPVGGRYVALAVHEAARIAGVAHGGQLVLSEQAVLLLDGALPEGAVLRDRGRYAVRDFPLPVRLHDVTATGVPPVDRGLRAVPADGGNLPPATAPLLGRDDVLAVLAEPARSTTLVGPPGVGKTATALAAARARTAPDGVWLVPLEPLPALRSVASAVLSTLGLPVTGGDAVGAQLGGREALLLLDGADDRLAEVAALSAELSRPAPGVQLLVTARAPLRVPGERVVRIGPLPVPGEHAAADDVLAAPPVRLLLAGDAQRWDHPRHADALGRLARRADGLPLALELVGARLAVLTPEDLLSRVDAQLARAGRTGALRAALDSAWSALPDSARRLWERLSVFAGPVHLDAVEQVCADEATLPEDEVVDALALLVGGSVALVEQHDDGSATYRLLRTVRQYGAERLDEAGQAELLRARHTEWVAGAVERWLRRVDAEPPPGALHELAAAQDDVLVGLGRLVRSEPERVVGLLLPLRRHLRESLDLTDLTGLAAQLPDVPGAAAVRALLRGQLSWERAPGPDTIPLLIAAADAGEHAPPAIRGDVLVQLILAREQFALAPDRVREDELERAAAESGDPALLVRATALRAHTGSPEDAALLDRAVELARTTAPGLLLWAVGRRLHLWDGGRPELAAADIDHLLLTLPLVGASESTAGLLMVASALLTLGRPEQAGRIAAQAAEAAARRRNVVMAFHAAALRTCVAGALGDPDAPRQLAELRDSPVGRLGAGGAATVELTRGWVLAGSDRDGARQWAADVPTDDPILGPILRALAAAVADPGWHAQSGLLGHLGPR